MKRIIAIIIAAAFMLTLASCGGNTNNESGSSATSSEGGTENMNTNVGAFTLAESPEITKDIQKMFKKAAKKVKGVKYEPYAYVASQVVAGTNHLILCKSTASGASTFYSLVTVYEDLNGKSEITDVLNSTTSAPDNSKKNESGGWGDAGPALTQQVRTALDKACETLTGAVYTPVAYVAMQVVGGFKYRILCQAKASVEELDAEPYYVLVTVYSSADGIVEITQTDEFGG